MNAGAAALFATAETARAVERARAVVVLVGGYDGCGNYGDIAQFEAALDLVKRLGPGILPLPVLERQHLIRHRQLIKAAGTRGSAALFFDPGDEGLYEDDLVPIAAPARPAFGASYLYGGGYLNHRWGSRRLTMLDAAEDLLAASGAAPCCRLSSGLQIEPGWVEAVSVGEAGALKGLDLGGVRDRASLEALEALGQGAPVVNTGDDALGILGRLPVPDSSPPDDGRLRLNVHFAKHGWVTEQPQALLNFYTTLMTELGRLTGRSVTVQPLIAYLDELIDERPGVETLAAACAAQGIEVADPLTLRPASLAETAPRLRAASLTLSCSYHAALTSLMLGVPALLMSDNAYYEQKAGGLREDFRLPSAFSSGGEIGNAAQRAGEIAKVLLDPKRSEALQDGLATAAERLHRRRAATETELLGRLGRAAVAALGDKVDELTVRVGRLAAEPAELHVRLASLQSEAETHQHLAEESPLEAEIRMQDAETRAIAAEEALAALMQSRSWRLMAPLRRLKALLRRS